MEVLQCAFLSLEAKSLSRCSLACRDWRQVAAENVCWQAALSCCGKFPYTASVTEEGVEAWICRELGGDIDGQRGHLRRLQETRLLRDLFRFLHEFHNGVELELQAAKRAQAWYNGAVVNATITVEILNYWPHPSWVLLRAVPPAEAHIDVDSHAGGGTGRVRCWRASKEEQFCYMLDCGHMGELFHLPPLSTAEIGMHRISGHVGAAKTMLVEYSMGRWSPEGPPLPAWSADAFLALTAADAALVPGEDDLPDILREIDESWFAGHHLLEPCAMGPALYRGTVELDVSPWI